MNDSASVLPDPFSTSLAGRRLGRYEVLVRLASGGMAAVYVARALGVAGFERLFAVKVLHPHLAHEQEFITMFLDEARLAARIRHPNVVPTTDISDTQDAGYYLVMDYIEGDHLGALLQKAYKAGVRLPAPVALRIIIDALEGLAAAHALTDDSGRRINLVHRDVSPHNIMVSTDGIARITDFGVAKAEVRLSTTRQGQFKGKLAYMAPEHASTGDADQRSDLFSAAIILWECLTGTRLFRAENQAATLNKICIEPIPMPSSIDPGLAPFDTIMARALARDPEERFQTAEEFAEAIEERADALGGLANQRAVAKIVREFASEKIERDRELIRSSIADIGVSGYVPEPDAGAAARSSPPAASAAGDHGTSSSRPAQFGAPESASMQEFANPRRSSLWVIVALLLAVGGVGAAALLMRDQASDVTASPLPVETGAREPANPTSADSDPDPALAAPLEPPAAGAKSEAKPDPTQVAQQQPVGAETAERGELDQPQASDDDRASERNSARERRPRQDSARRSTSGSDRGRDRSGERNRRPKSPEVLLNPYR